MKLNVDQLERIANLYYADRIGKPLTSGLNTIFMDPQQWLNDSAHVLCNMLLIDRAYNANWKMHDNQLMLFEVVLSRIRSIKEIISAESVNASELAGFVDNILRDAQTKIGPTKHMKPHKAPYLISVLSKFLHFTAPYRFPIWDKLILNSWSKMTTQMKRSHANTDGLQYLKEEDGKSQYQALIRFYDWLIADTLLPAECQHLTQLAKTLGARTLYGLLDKAFWSAEGGMNPDVLGKLEPWLQG